jgi:hypothetical protein
MGRSFFRGSKGIVILAAASLLAGCGGFPGSLDIEGRTQAVRDADAHPTGTVDAASVQFVFQANTLTEVVDVIGGFLRGGIQPSCEKVSQSQDGETVTSNGTADLSSCSKGQVTGTESIWTQQTLTGSMVSTEAATEGNDLCEGKFCVSGSYVASTTPTTAEDYQLQITDGGTTTPFHLGVFESTTAIVFDDSDSASFVIGAGAGGFQITGANGTFTCQQLGGTATVAHGTCTGGGKSFSF